MTPLETTVRALPSISLSELDSASALMSRIDRKYFVPADVLAELLPRVGGGPRALQIDGLRTFRYDTVYFDSPGFDLYRQHVQRRRHRFKVRTRLYRDSGDCRLEVKSKGLRELTVKQRIPHDPDLRLVLDSSDHRFINSITRTSAASLHPVLETRYCRTTLSDGDHRITLDQKLEWIGAGQRIEGPADVLVETKSPGGAGDLDRMLLSRAIRPHAVSKYCLAASLIYPRLRGNDWSRIRRRYWSAA